MFTEASPLSERKYTPLFSLEGISGPCEGLQRAVWTINKLRGTQRMNSFRNRARQAGQGMTEYIIIVALVAVAAISVYNLFGDTVRGQVGDLAAELGGGKTQKLGNNAGNDAQKEGKEEYDLANFDQAEK